MPKGLLFRYGKALDRIAELEAELAGLRSEYQATRGFLSRAEAEVERWKTLLIDEFVLRGLSPDEAREAVHILERVRVA